MPAKARLYIGTTISLGLALLAASLVWFRECPDVARYLACASLACIASTLKVRLPGLHGTISVNFVFILMGIARLSLAETLTLGVIATVVQCFWRSRIKPRFVQVLFNVAALVVSTTAAYATAHMVPGPANLILALAPAATVFFVLNTGMVSLVLALISDRRVLSVWRQCHLWTFPYYLVGAAIASQVSISGQNANWRLSLLLLPLMYLVYWYYSFYVSSQTARQQAY